MKELFTYMMMGFLLMGWNGIEAQNSLSVTGRVLDAQGVPVASHLITIELSLGGVNPTSIRDTAVTNFQGLFTRNYQVSNDSGNAVVSLDNCPILGGQLIDTSPVTPSDSVLFFDFVWCENTCNALYSSFSQGLRSNFTDQSISYYALTNQTWDFGDGNTASGSQVSHLYSSPGTYTVCLQIADSSGCSDTYCDTVVVETCTANFTWTNPSPNRVELTAQASNTLAPLYIWDLGDGSQASGQQVFHIYAGPGNYPVRLILQDSLTNCLDTVIEVISIIGDQACEADFLPVFLSRDSILFQNNSTHSLPTGGSITYSWAFGDGNNSTNVSPVHVYQNPGDYLACLLMEDDFGCRDSICQTIRILPGPVCDPSFVFNPISNLTVAFSALFVESGNTYSWTIQDGSTYQSPSFFHTFDRPGKYEVCLTVADSTGECVDSLCQELTLSAEELCVSDFNWNRLDSNKVAFYSLASVVDPSNARFSWDFGDGTGSNALNPVHTYASNGPWNVCLLVIDGSGSCTQERCYSIDLNSPPPNAYEISGWVYLDGIPSFNAHVDLFQDIQGQDELNKYGEDPVSFEAYRLENVVSGSYLVYAEELEESGYMPTYLGGKLYWQEAISSIVNNRNVVNPRLDLIKGMDVQGPGSISGKVFEGLTLPDGPSLGAVVMLILVDNPGRTPVTYTRTDQNGAYNLSNLPYGAYWVQPEIPGIYAAARRVVIGPSSENMTEVSFGIGQGFGFPVEVEELETLGISPNPADQVVEVEGHFRALKVFNSLGQEVFRTEENGGLGLRISTSEWPEGLYFLEVSGKQQNGSKRLMIRH